MLWSMLPDPFPDVQVLALVCAALIADLNSQVNDLRGKFVKPTLKKVSKYENKFAKLQKKAAEFNFRNQLKVVKKKEFTLEEEDKEKKPDWSKGKPGDQKVKEEEVEA
ncbi:Troponin I [Papilio machaon]|uniref:Troponin I n=1 Tax=Papilio machaon TaxID=76193 RepID=A0A194RDC8_PAPMA|nr:Troponin I [Papilio machaon]